jgi:hypothetical protein
MKLFFLQTPGKDQKDDQTVHLPVPLNESTQNVTDGGEFLDDALRMKEQPFMYVYDCVAAGCFDGIL